MLRSLFCDGRRNFRLEIRVPALEFQSDLTVFKSQRKYRRCTFQQRDSATRAGAVPADQPDGRADGRVVAARREPDSIFRVRKGD